MKRSLGPSRFLYDPKRPEVQAPPKGLRPLDEGPVVCHAPPSHGTTTQEESHCLEAKPYSRGSLKLAIHEATLHPNECAEHIGKRAKAESSRLPIQSKEKTWAAIASAAGFSTPFVLTPQLIFTVTGALDKAGYRSTEQYLETARQAHISAGHAWTQQLNLAAKQAKRACQRGRGPAKQAQPLPMKELAALQHTEPAVAPGGPAFPVRATLLASWWLLREIEASYANVSHVTVDDSTGLIHWKLPSSKADWKALGAVRTHMCTCSEKSKDRLCPFHLMSAQVEWCKRHGFLHLLPQPDGSTSTKAGWADTFEHLGKQLKLPILTDTGLRRFTGHSARATGAIHLAHTHTELWRIQLFGRWGSDCFLRYVRDAPLSQLFGLAQEATLQTSLAAARAELAAILAKVPDSANRTATTDFTAQKIEVLAECEAANTLVPDVPVPACPLFVVNLAPDGKVHKVGRSGPHLPHYLWRAACSWPFARHHADYDLTDTRPTDRKLCAKCFKLPKTKESDEESSSSSSSSSESCAPQVGSDGQ